MRAHDIPELKDLSTPEMILLVEDIWETIAADPSAVPVPESHRREIQKRLQNYSHDRGRLLSHEELQERINARK